MNDPRLKTARRWHDEAQRYLKEKDFFSAYFAGYISLAVFSALFYSENCGGPTETADDQWESKAIRYTLEKRAAALSLTLAGPPVPPEVADLRSRVVHGVGDRPIMGAQSQPDDALDMSTKTLYDLWSPLRTMGLTQAEADRHARALETVFRKVRNRLFHGQKDYGVDTDADLLERLTPVLLTVVTALLEHRGGK